MGTNGPDTTSGTVFSRGGLIFPLPDVIHGLGGSDSINGGDDDFICGGDGNDTLIGGSGNNALIAGFGTDALDGGTGTDICTASSLTFFDRPDTFTGCETVNAGGAGISGEWLEIERHCNRSSKHPRCRLDGSLRVFNPGTENSAVASRVAFFLSEDNVLDESDSFLTIGEVGVLDVGEENIVKLKLKLPDENDVSGTFVIAVVDFYDDLSERNEGTISPYRRWSQNGGSALDAGTSV